MPSASSPIGVFDSGVGGLSVLQALRAELPQERFVYLADNGHAPYGERGDAFVAARTQAITSHLRDIHGIKALVVACNTATAAAIDQVRASHPGLPLVGVEPALKPAVAATRTGRAGVIGTRGTLSSARFARLQASLPGHVHWVVQPCDGLAYAIERAALGGDSSDAGAEVQALCARYLQAMGPFGGDASCIDTLVLGCTHYVFAQEVLRPLAGPGVQLIETGQPVARQTRRLLQGAGLLASHAPLASDAALRLLTTGDLDLLRAAAARWLQLPADCCSAAEVPAPAHA
ncbi:glutamate racemase [Acidovorax sp. YS12]|nr:glutamate racemase [Acidovorax sp. YS12]